MNYSAHLFKLMAVVGFTYPLSAIMVNLILGLGYSGKNLKLGLWKKGVGLIALVFGFLWGIEIFLYALIGRNIFSLILNMIYVRNIINLSVAEQFKLIYKFIIFALIIAVPIELEVHINNIYISFFVKGGLFSFAYLVLTFFFKKEIKTLILDQLNNIKKTC